MSENRKRIVIEVSEALYNQVKGWAGFLGLRMQQLGDEAFRDFVKKCEERYKGRE